MKFFTMNDNISDFLKKFDEYVTLNPTYADLSNDAMSLYKRILIRTANSIRNGSRWFTAGLGVFVIFSREEAAQLLHCSVRSATRLFQTLAAHGLIVEKRRGIRLANYIYAQMPVEAAATKEEKPKKKWRFWKEKAQPQQNTTEPSVIAKDTSTCPQKGSLSSKEQTDTLSQINRHIASQGQKESRPVKRPAFFIPEDTTLKIKDQIEYSWFIQNRKTLGTTKTMIDAIVRCMAELVTAPTTRIGKVTYYAFDVEPIVKTMDSEMIRSFLEKIRTVSFQAVKNCKAYLKSMLFNFAQDYSIQLDTYAFF